MKGIIACCMAEMITEKFGQDKWEAVLADAGLPEDASFALTDDVDDAIVVKAVGSALKVLGLSLEQFADAFGAHWISNLTTKHYSPVYTLYKSSRELMLGINDIHKQAVKFIPGAQPPRFEFNWEDDKTVIIEYKSQRGLIDFAVGITRGLGAYYKEALEVSKISDTHFKVVFP